MLPLRKADTEFATKINETLKKLRDNGTMAELSNKWFGKDVTKNISKWKPLNSKN